jgi:hypothetical protein
VVVAVVRSFVVARVAIVDDVVRQSVSRVDALGARYRPWVADGKKNGGRPREEGKKERMLARAVH